MLSIRLFARSAVSVLRRWLLATVSVLALPSVSLGADTVQDIQLNVIAQGQPVSLTGLIVTAVSGNSLWVQDPASPSPEWSGIRVFLGTAPTVSVGDEVNVSGTTAEFFEETEIVSPTVTLVGAGTPIDPAVLSVSQAALEDYEGVLVKLTQVQSVTVPFDCSVDGACTDPDLWLVDDNIAVWQEAYEDADWVSRMGVTPVAGVMSYRWNRRRILPRTTADFAVAVAADPCVVVDNGFGTVDLPPDGCEYLSPDEVHEITDGLPPGTTIVFDAIHKNFICGSPTQICTELLLPGLCEGQGGSLGGNVECFQSEVQFTISGTGVFASFNRVITVPLDTEVHTGPRNTGELVQVFDNSMQRLQGQIFGDPDFCVLSVTGGAQFGFSGTGETILKDQGDGTFTVDSFFDIEYRIDYQGCPGGQLDGFAGSTVGSLRMETGNPPPPVQIPALSGAWLWFFASLLAVASYAVIRRLVPQR